MRRMLCGFLGLAAVAAMVAAFGAAAGRSGEIAAEEERRQLERAVLRAALSCYAVEGYYPASLDTLEENYGLRYNEAQYIVRYDCFADNVLPDISVYDRG